MDLDGLFKQYTTAPKVDLSKFLPDVSLEGFIRNSIKMGSYDDSTDGVMNIDYQYVLGLLVGSDSSLDLSYLMQ